MNAVVGLLDVGRLRGITCFVIAAALIAASGSCLPSACCAELCTPQSGHTDTSASNADLPQAGAGHGRARDGAACVLARGRCSAAPRAQLAAQSAGMSPGAAQGARESMVTSRATLARRAALRLPQSHTLPGLPG